MTTLCAAARNFSALFGARLGVGVGEATLSPSTFSLLSDYFPREKLGTALSVFSMGIFFGSGLALIIGGLVIGAVGSWRTTFVVVGLPGLLAALLVYTIKEPARKSLLLIAQGQASRLSFAEVAGQVEIALAIGCRHLFRACVSGALQLRATGVAPYVLCSRTWLDTATGRFHAGHHFPHNGIVGRVGGHLATAAGKGKAYARRLSGRCWQRRAPAFCSAWPWQCRNLSCKSPCFYQRSFFWQCP